MLRAFCLLRVKSQPGSKRFPYYLRKPVSSSWFHSTLPESFSLAENWREEYARAFDALVRIDKRTPEETWRVCKWARADSFWASKFLSPLKLRRRNRERITYFDAFCAQMNGNKPCRPKTPESFI